MSVFEFSIRLSNVNNNSHQGCVEIETSIGVWTFVCDNKFSMEKANNICKNLGFNFGASETMSCSSELYDVKSYNGLRLDNFRYSAKSLESFVKYDFSTSECKLKDAVGVVCKISKMVCPTSYWLCENVEECVPLSFLCDGVADCKDGADENPLMCTLPIEYRLSGRISTDTPFEGRAEIRYKGTWGTICDDNFKDAEASVFCRSLGFNGTESVSSFIM